MTTDLTQIDPQSAWAAYEPATKTPWTRRLVAHLYRRAGFGADGAELDAAVKAGPTATIDRLCNPPPPTAEFQSTSDMLAERTVAGGNPQQLAAWWLYRMFNTADPLLEKLTLFWHGHFASSVVKVTNAQMMFDQNQLLRQHARGKFEEMVRAISRDPAMLVYLDSTTNRRIHPNENYARELMELFTLGVGNYSEDDIKQMARAFTGWEVRGDHFNFDPIQHDIAAKTFLGHSGNFDGNDAIHIVLEQPAASRFIARKLVRYFVFDEPPAPDLLIEPLAEELRSNGFDIGAIVRRIISSNLFFSENAIGKKIRSPVEFVVGLLKPLDGMTSLVRLAQATADLGQTLFAPPNVKGWDGGRTWINSSTLLGRANIAGQILTAAETHFGKSDDGLAGIAAQAGAAEPRRTVDWLLELLVAVELTPGVRDELVNLASRKDEADRSRCIAQIIHAICALPEFQLA